MSIYHIEKESLEKETKVKISKYLKDNSIWYKMSQPGTFGSNSGTSDYTCLKKGLFIAIEAKRNSSKSKLSKKQEEYLAEVVANGGYSIVISCEEDIMRLDTELKSRGIL